MDHFIGALKKYAVFTGRASRKEYWMFYLFFIGFYIGFVVIDSLLDMQGIDTQGIPQGIFAFALFIPAECILIRRLHDTGRSGWWQLITFIPIIGAIVLIVFLVQDSQEANEYGVNPKSGEQAET